MKQYHGSVEEFLAKRLVSTLDQVIRHPEHYCEGSVSVCPARSELVGRDAPFVCTPPMGKNDLHYSRSEPAQAK